MLLPNIVTQQDNGVFHIRIRMWFSIVTSHFLNKHLLNVQHCVLGVRATTANKIIFALKELTIKYSDFQPWQHTRITWAFFKILMPRPYPKLISHNFFLTFPSISNVQSRKRIADLGCETDKKTENGNIGVITAIG